MSEFENPGQSVSASESIAPNEPAETSPEWQTVDFPGAISVDSIPMGSAIAVPFNVASTLEAADMAQMDVVELTAFIQTLQQENHLLREQVVQLENDLTEVQIQTQLDDDMHQTGFPPVQASPHPAQAMLIASQEQVSRLFQELELSHQANQRQQILVETLQSELHKSRHYINELEQNVAVLQQQCISLGQQRDQAESDCHDLRLRLHRQQQQTLQFKAALERSLETTAPPSINLEEVTEPTVEAEPTAQPANSQPTVRVNNPPVQPWSAPSNRGTKHFNDSLLKPIAQLFSQDSEPESTESTVNLVEQPEALEMAASEPELAEAALDSDAAELIAEVELQPEAAITESTEAVTPIAVEHGLEALPGETTTQVLWQDLAKLIETVAPSVAETLRTNPPAEMLQLQSEGMNEPYASNLRFDAAETIAQASLRTAERESALPEAAASLQNIPGMPKDSPSPTLYPKRVTKKRESLAAVELPTFPRKES